MHLFVFTKKSRYKLHNDVHFFVSARGKVPSYASITIINWLPSSILVTSRINREKLQYLSEELWPSLPEDVQTTSYEKKLADTTGVTGTIESTGTIVDNLPRTFVDSILDAQILEDERML